MNYDANITSSPFLRGPREVSDVMLQVIYALLPAAAAHLWLFGWGLVPNLLIAVTVALLSEAGMLKATGKPLAPYLSDGSAMVTGVLLAMALPPMSPWWLTVVGTGFAVVVAKHLYGGLGYNPFNPAMVGYVALLISFPVEMTTWLPPESLRQPGIDLATVMNYVFTGALPSGMGMDAISGATPLDAMKTQLRLEKTVGEVVAGNALFGSVAGRGWEVVNTFILFGGLYLVARRIITWHVPVGMLGALFVIATIFHLGFPDRFPGPFFHLFAGGAMLGAFFIATDPVSGATSPKGRLIFGAGVGVLTYIIRTWGGYPDGVAFSVLLMNMTAPTIDYYTRPRVYGHGRGD